MSNRWAALGTALLLLAIAVVILLLVAIPLHNFYGATYGEVLVHTLWGAAALVVAQLHTRLVLPYVGILIAYQNKQPGTQSMEFASYASGMLIAVLVNSVWEFFIRPTVKPNDKGPTHLTDRFR